MSEHVHVVASFTVKAETADAFAAAAKRLLVAPAVSEPGCIRYELTRDRDDPTRFAMIETWATAADLQTHLGQSYMGPALEELRPFVASELDVKHFLPA